MIIFVERCVQISSVDSMCDTHTLRGTVSSNESNNGSETTTAAPSCTIGRRMHRDACAEPKIFKMSIWHFSRRHHYIATADPRVFSIQRGALHPPMRRARVSASAISCRVLIKSIASRPPAAPPPPPLPRVHHSKRVSSSVSETRRRATINSSKITWPV